MSERGLEGDGTREVLAGAEVSVKRVVGMLSEGVYVVCVCTCVCV